MLINRYPAPAKRSAPSMALQPIGSLLFLKPDGAAPVQRLNALLKAAVSPYPTRSAISSMESLVVSRYSVETFVRTSSIKAWKLRFLGNQLALNGARSGIELGGNGLQRRSLPGTVEQ